MVEMKCGNGYSCLISVELREEQPVLVFDFDIKEYKVFNQGWKDIVFPENISMNDKLYLNEDMKNNVLSVLDSFIQNQDLQAVEDKFLTQTARGFNVIDMKDLEGQKISIQESSSAEEGKIWFGCVVKEVYLKEESELVLFKFPEGDMLVNDRLHLRVKDAEKMTKIINTVWQSFELEQKLENKTSFHSLPKI